MSTNLEFVEHDNPSVDEHNGLPHVVVMSVFWKGLMFLRAVRYLEDSEDYEDEPASAKIPATPSKANNFAGCESRVYLYSELKHFHLIFDHEIPSLDEAKALAYEAEKTLVKFARDIHMRKSPTTSEG